MQDTGRRAKLIAEVISYLEDMDGDELKGQMAPPEPPPEELPADGVAVMAVEGEEPAAEMGLAGGEAEMEEELSDEELDELSRLSS